MFRLQGRHSMIVAQTIKATFSFQLPNGKTTANSDASVHFSSVLTCFIIETFNVICYCYGFRKKGTPQ